MIIKAAFVGALVICSAATAQDARTNVLYRIDCADVLELAIEYPKGERNPVYNEDEHAAAYFILLGAAISTFKMEEERKAFGRALGRFAAYCETDPAREVDSILRSLSNP